ncbi:MAG TPA: cytochrome c [Saprospiraceae bacterium]|nr:cytochrome c [Saprospiraceae bacterium]
MYKFLISFVLAALIIACAGKDKAPAGPADVADGVQIYKKYCIICHGADGKLGVNGAKDLTVCKFTQEEREMQIKNGKNTMTPFEGILTDAQIKSVAAYTMTLK